MSSGTLPGTSHAITIGAVAGPKSNKKARQDIEHMPTSGTMPKSQASSYELSFELSRISAN